MDKTYCKHSDKCALRDCPRHLKGFNAMYISLAEFDCEKEYKRTSEDSEQSI